MTEDEADAIMAAHEGRIGTRTLLRNRATLYGKVDLKKIYEEQKRREERSSPEGQ